MRVFRELSARRGQRRWSREAHRLLAELDRIDRLHGLGTLPAAAPPNRRRRLRYDVWPSLLATLVILAGVVFLTPGPPGYRIRTLLGVGVDRLSSVVHVPHGHGHFRFEMTQPGSSRPVSYDPCQEIRYAVNPEGAPDDYRAFVDQAAARVGEATGFKFRDIGSTDDRRFLHRTGDPERSDPVLIGWATPEEVPDLGGDVAGLGGSAAVSRTPDHLSYVTGMVVLDRDLFADLSAESGGFDEERAIVMHELGHVVGLGHVDDPGELMNAHNEGRTSFGPGDLEGLAELGAVDCL